MGWSCSAAASRTAEAITRACLAQTDSQNGFALGPAKYFWETARTEHADGKITGQIYRVRADDTVLPAGRFSISADGKTVTPKAMADLAKAGAR